MDTRFVSVQTVEMTVAKQSVPIQHYLRQPQRIVQALAASSQIEQLGEEQFRLKMRPLSFMMLTIQPTVEMRVWSEPDGTVQIRSTDCEIRGVEYINQRFSLKLVGKLQPQDIQGITYLRGRADLEVQVELPPALMFTPRAFLEAAGNGLLKSVLLTVKQRLMHHLLADYYAWAQSCPNPAIAPLGLSSNSPIA
jgi:hypothetical protein